MPLLQWLKDVGGRLGVIRIVSTSAPSAPDRLPTRTVTLQELMGEVRAEEIRALADSPSDLLASPEQIFAASGVATPPHGWTVERLAEFLRTADRAAMPREPLQRLIVETLAKDSANAGDIVKDAVARDHALDTFELFVRERLDRRREARLRRRAGLDDRLRELKAALDHLDAEARDEESRWRTWHRRKVETEKTMSWAVSFLVEDPVVSIDNDPPDPVP